MIVRSHAVRGRFRAVAVLLLGSAVAAAAVAVGSSLTGTAAHAAFPGENGKIVCVGEGRDRTAPQLEDYEIFTINPDGSGQKYLTDTGSPTVTGPFVDEFDPVFSPNGQKIAFESNRTGGPEIFTMNSDGSNPKRLTAAQGTDRPGTYSPDGSKIVFDSVREDPNRSDIDVYTMNADGTDQTRILEHVGQDSNPSWSPDGTRIAFQSIRKPGEPGNNDPAGTPANLEIYTMNTSGGDIRRVTNFSATDAFPQWSPDGTKLTFRRDLPGTGPTGGTNSEIFTVNPDGSDPQNLSKNGVDNPVTSANDSTDDVPVFSPDGTKIAFDSFRSGDREVYTMNADGSEVKRLTNAQGFDGRCDWGPPASGGDALGPAGTPGNPPRGERPRHKRRTSLAITKVRPRRDRRPPFRFIFSGRVKIPSGVSRAGVCGGKVKLVLKKRRRTVAQASARVSKRCTYRKRITIRSTRRTGTKKARLRVIARYGGNASLRGSRRSTTVRIF